MWTVGETAALAHVSVRTLHHYDEIGLVRPSARSDAGYRLYGHDDLERLHQVLVLRELGFALDEIRTALDDPASDPTEALLVQRELLEGKASYLRKMIAAIDKTLEARQKGIPMDEKDLFEVFGDDDPTKYEGEARERWGDTYAYQESARRAKGYSKEEWLRIKAEQDAIEADHPMPLVPPLAIDGLIRGDGVQPRTHFSAFLELIALEMNLQERLLKNILGHLGIVQVMSQVTVKLLFIPPHQLLEGASFRLAAVCEQQFLVGSGGQAVLVVGTRFQVFNRAV